MIMMAIAASKARSPPERAALIVGLYDKTKAEGAGAVAFEGKMIDEPVVRRAERLLARHRRIADRMSG